jgi:anti-sigma-K factor RskA
VVVSTAAIRCGCVRCYAARRTSLWQCLTACLPVQERQGQLELQSPEQAEKQLALRDNAWRYILATTAVATLTASTLFLYRKDKEGRQALLHTMLQNLKLQGWKLKLF